ncbi:unnamed protein product [Allacma fusca]|uniref:Uncharacterized protein n=1 Tax=Allacma fusca TaxID=39272 RepID=A0A8J2JW37_9HEXA|nr:unnamed protein product [Allacma fusca]
MFTNCWTNVYKTLVEEILKGRVNSLKTTAMLVPDFEKCISQCVKTQLLIKIFNQGYSSGIYVFKNMKLLKHEIVLGCRSMKPSSRRALWCYKRISIVNAVGIKVE